MGGSRITDGLDRSTSPNRDDNKLKTTDKGRTVAEHKANQGLSVDKSHAGLFIGSAFSTEAKKRLNKRLKAMDDKYQEKIPEIKDMQDLVQFTNSLSDDLSDTAKTVCTEKYPPKNMTMTAFYLRKAAIIAVTALAITAIVSVFVATLIGASAAAVPVGILLACAVGYVCCKANEYLSASSISTSVKKSKEDVEIDATILNSQTAKIMANSLQIMLENQEDEKVDIRLDPKQLEAKKHQKIASKIYKIFRNNQITDRFKNSLETLNSSARALVNTEIDRPTEWRQEYMGTTSRMVKNLLETIVDSAEQTVSTKKEKQDIREAMLQHLENTEDSFINDTVDEMFTVMMATERHDDPELYKRREELKNIAKEGFSIWI